VDCEHGVETRLQPGGPASCSSEVEVASPSCGSAFPVFLLQLIMLVGKDLGF
jgi:hypothetical protein